MVQLLGLMVFIFLSAGSTFALQVNVRSSALVDGDQVQINDVARLTPPLGNLLYERICRAPAPGKSIAVTQEQIERILLQHGVDPTAVKFSGAPSTQVTRDSLNVTQEQAQGFIDGYLAKVQQKLPQAQFKFTPQATIKDTILPTGELRVEVIPSLEQVIGSRRFTLIYRVDGRTVENVSISGKLEVLAEIAVAQRNLRRGTIISADDVNLTLLDISKIDQPFYALADVVGQKVIRSVRAASVLEGKNLDAPPLVQKGAFVKLIARRGRMLLTATGIAMEEGKMGEMIRVRNSASQKEVLARVIGRDQVEVGF